MKLGLLIQTDSWAQEDTSLRGKVAEKQKKTICLAFAIPYTVCLFQLFFLKNTYKNL